LLQYLKTQHTNVDEMEMTTIFAEMEKLGLIIESKEGFSLI
jgi:hypothetical protein